MTHPDLVASSIEKCQKHFGFKDCDARWYHAAVYVSHGHVCEATRKGVHVVSVLKKYVPGYWIRVRRDPSLSDVQLADVGFMACGRLHEDYSFKTIGNMVANYYKHQDYAGIHDESTDAGVICSQLYSDAYTMATEKTLHNAAKTVPCPAMLSLSSKLKDVQARWLTIGSSNDHEPIAET